MVTAVSSAGPSADVHGWLAWVILLGAIAVALVAIRQAFIYIVVPVVRVIRRAAQAMETLGDIATEFRPNGQTLHDRLVSIDERTEDTHRIVVEVHDYAHDSHHDIVNALSASGLSAAIVQKLVDRLDPGGPQHIGPT